jgi:hypothetical protein
MTTNRRLIGHVAVDSGTAAIVDPCNADKVDDVFTKMIDDRADTISLDGLAISNVGLGDGFYPVFIETGVLAEGWGRTCYQDRHRLRRNRHPTCVPRAACGGLLAGIFVVTPEGDGATTGLCEMCSNASGVSLSPAREFSSDRCRVSR